MNLFFFFISNFKLHQEHLFLELYSYLIFLIYLKGLYLLGKKNILIQNRIQKIFILHCKLNILENNDINILVNYGFIRWTLMQSYREK